MQHIEDLKKLFKDKALLEQSLTHKSWLNENAHKRASYERLEFLGDAVLQLVVTSHLYKNFPEKEEGYLTALRANIVNTANLSKFAKKINLGNDLFLSKGESESGGRNNDSLLADTVEAIIGALYLDSGLASAEKFIVNNLLIDLSQKISGPLKDAKSQLQEYLQSKKIPVPVYNVTEATGPTHARQFTVEVVINEKALGKGSGKSKLEAQENAAGVALKHLLKKQSLS